LIEIKAADATLSKIPRAHRKASKPIEHVAGGGAATAVRYFSGLGRSSLAGTTILEKPVSEAQLLAHLGSLKPRRW
jgi:hypothetical protein